MSYRVRSWVIGLGVLAGVGAAHADMVGVLQPDPIQAAAAVAFQNSNVVPGTISGNGAFNFLDQWNFSLTGSFNVSSVATSIAFTDSTGQSVLLGITNLEVDLVSLSQPGTPLVSWQNVTHPVTGLDETVALIPTSPLGAGDYALQVRGDVVQPGAYSGSMLVTPPAVVPLPGGAPLFAAGVAVLAAVGARRRVRNTAFSPR